MCAHKTCRISQVARPWSGKPMVITSVPSTPLQKPILLKLGEVCKQPVTAFKTAKDACQAKWLQTSPIDGSGLPRGSERMLLILQVGMAGEGKDAIAADSKGRMQCTQSVPLRLAPLPAAFAAEAQPREAFWVPGNGSHALG